MHRDIRAGVDFIILFDILTSTFSIQNAQKTCLYQSFQKKGEKYCLIENIFVLLITYNRCSCIYAHRKLCIA